MKIKGSKNRKQAEELGLSRILTPDCDASTEQIQFVPSPFSVKQEIR
ncbi:hypothetical protein LCGC14_0863790 [marine sediment metagenome]|uniref:Uncharacterized protein n=1 Tax=marine sediment metagenome TaxID=412755 RepID=A0A0F9SDQ5_9ZZZZ